MCGHSFIHKKIKHAAIKDDHITTRTHGKNKTAEVHVLSLSRDCTLTQLSTLQTVLQQIKHVNAKFQSKIRGKLTCNMVTYSLMLHEKYKQ